MSELKEPAFLRVRFYTTLPAVLLLLSVLAYGTGSLLHARLLQLGEHLWPGYHAMRVEVTAPECDPAALRQRRDATLEAPTTPAPAGDELDLDDVIREGAGATPGGTPSPGAEVDLDDLLEAGATGEGTAGGDAPAAPAVPPAPRPPAPERAPIPAGDAAEVDLDALLAEATPRPASVSTPAGAPALAEAAPVAPALAEARRRPAPVAADAAAPAGEAGEVDLDALLAEAAPAPLAAAPGGAPAGDATDVDLGEILDETAAAPAPGAAAAGAADKPDAWYANEALLTQCERAHAAYTEAKSRITPWLVRYRTVETGLQRLTRLGVDSLSHMLALLVLICGVATTVFKHHIALRPPRSRLDHLVCDGAQLFANALLLHSSWVFKQYDVDAVGQPQHAALHWIWIGGFAVLCLANVYNLLRPPPVLAPSSGVLRALLSVPLYATMALIAGGYFLIGEDHGAGLAIYVAKLTEHAILYLNVGLYVWVGMLLKRTKLANLCFDALRPWRLAPELLAFVAVVGAALPTAYSGASGIFVIAAGAVIYRELRKAGARRQLALAATAMSGSMGVVLSPCLLVVIVASLNQEVVTDQLYFWGNRVFLLSAVLFLAVALWTRQGPLTVARPREALPGTVAALRQLLPYVLLFVVLLVAYRYTLDAGLDEHSAPVILPVLMIGVLLYDRVTKREVVNRSGRVVRFGFRKALAAATSETTGHIGALLLLMGLSVCLGGIIERAELMSLIPVSFGSVWLTMAVLVVALVLIGMTMDPYGAVVLVSATITGVAYNNGVDPVHFWMVVLVAFELGYLTPPVALNHLLTRQVVGDARVERAENEPGGAWARNERVLLPIVVMGVALLVVAFGPLLLDGYPVRAAVETAAISSSASP
ncbi:MAG: TRAP transporter large permease subunit [Myxococcales bacterium]|nr:TRAP transporter large permease subunit [Myxococcales bacterium]